MEKSESIKEIASALRKFQYQVDKVSKDGTNPFFKSKYATLENVIDTIKEQMFNEGLSYVQFPQERGLYTILMHTSGEYIGAWSALVIKDETPQGQGSAITYLRRYALSSILGIATEDDDDGNAASEKKPAAKPVAPKVVQQGKDAKKKAIAELLQATAKADPQNLFDDLKTAEDYATACLQYTGLALVEENFDAIIKKLTK